MADIEDIYEALAMQIDRLDTEAGALFLAQAALALAHALDDPDRALSVIALAARPDPARA